MAMQYIEKHLRQGYQHPSPEMTLIEFPSRENVLNKNDGPTYMQLIACFKKNVRAVFEKIRKI